MQLDMVKLVEVKTGVVLWPQHWAEILVGLHLVAFAILMHKRFVALMVQSA